LTERLDAPTAGVTRAYATFRRLKVARRRRRRGLCHPDRSRCAIHPASRPSASPPAIRVARMSFHDIT